MLFSSTDIEPWQQLLTDVRFLRILDHNFGKQPQIAEINPGKRILNLFFCIYMYIYM